MSFANDGYVKRKPTSPGEMLREEFMPDYDLSTSQLANLLDVPPRILYDILDEERSIDADMAARLSSLFGTSSEYWLNLQRNADLWLTSES